MPSASSAKPEKQPSTEGTSSESSTSNTNQQNTPIRQAIVIIEHKIRNLDKRKAKLETYRELQRAGKDLNQDQKVAVAKYDEVSQTLEFARDLCKQFHNIVTASEKEAKKLARKEELHRRQQDIAKFKEVLLIQDALAQMGAENIREDFLLGRNGAAQISPEDLQLLDELYPIVSPKHASESEEGRPEFSVQVQQAAEHLLAVVDGRQKEFQGSTFAHVKQVINTIHSCGYLEKPPVSEEPVATATEEWTAAPDANVNANALPTDEYTNVASVTEVRQDIRPEVERIPDQMPPMPNFPPVPEQVVQPTVVPVVEQPYYQPPPQPQPRPINEMLETGSFYFLQESELDSPDLVAPHPQLAANAPIPSQTFTNQNFTNVPSAVPPLNTFASTPNLPPPIPMPPSHTSVQPPPINPTPYTEKVATTFSPPQTFDTYTSKKVETETRDNQKNGNEWSESPEERQNTQGGRSRGNNPSGGNRNRSTGGGGGGGSGGYYQNNYYQNNGYGSGGYKSRSGGAGRQGSGGTGGRQGGAPGGNKGGGGSGQYNRSKPSSQH